MAINDFGEKIGGAKKDLWKVRGLQIEDLLDMNDAEKTAHIKKDNVWKKPDYQELVDSGIPVRVVYFMKKIRDATPVKPVLGYSDKTPELIVYKQEGYISFVRDLRDAVMAMRTEADVLNFYKDYLSKNYITREPGKYYVTVSEKAFGCIDNKLLKTAQISNFYSLDREIQKKQFCYSEKDKQEALEKAFTNQFDVVEYNPSKIIFTNDYAGRVQVEVKLGYGSRFFYPQGEDADPASYEEGKWFVLRGSKIFAKNLDSRDDATGFVKSLFEESMKRTEEQPTQQKGKPRKTRFVPKQLKHIMRTGDDYRQGVPATGGKYMEVFGFKGGEFGNWMSENDRRASLDYGYDALVDMCKALNISAKDISLGGRLSIAFGARGSGSALAHYEPLREVINLTKMKGAGSLAHEWAHALDDIYGKALGVGGFMTEKIRNPAVPESFKELVDSMKYKSVYSEDVVKKQQATVERSSERLKVAVTNLFPTSAMTEEQKTKLRSFADAYVNNAKNCQDGFWACVTTGEGNKDIDALSNFKQEVTGRCMPKQQRIDFAHYQNNLRMEIEKVGRPERVKTDFYQNSIRFDDAHAKTDHGYWQSTVEMFARAFACYVNDKIDGKSDYLVGHSENAVSWSSNKRTGELEVIKAIPDGEERLVLNRCFDKLIVELKEKGLLHDFEPELAIAPEKKPSLMDQIKSSREKYDASFKEVKGGQLEFEF